MAKRGRPKKTNLELEIIKRLFPEATTRQGLYNKMYYARVASAAGKLGLIDNESRCTRTGKPMSMKLTIIGKAFADVTGSDWHLDPWASWLVGSWEAIVEMGIDELKEALDEVK